MSTWSAGKVEKAQRLFPKIIAVVAQALDVETSELETLWIDGRRPIVEAARQVPLTIELEARTEKPQGAPTVWTEERLALLRELAGKIPAAELPMRLGIGKSSLYRKASEMGLSLRHQGDGSAAAPVSPRGGRQSPWTPEKVTQLRQLAGTMRAFDLAAQLGLGTSTIYAKAAELGLSLRQVHAPAAEPAAQSGTDATPSTDLAADTVIIDRDDDDGHHLTVTVDARVAEILRCDPVRSRDEQALFTLQNFAGAYLHKSGSGFTHLAEAAWRGTDSQVTTMRRRRPETRRLAAVVADA